MPDRFKHYLPLDKETHDDIWKNGIIVLDTNIWLNFYRLPTEERENLKSILCETFISERLFVPNQVAEEFFRNRKQEIANQYTTSHDIEKKIKSYFDQAQQVLTERYKYHPIIIRDDLKNRISKALKEIRDEIDKNRTAYPYTQEEDRSLTFVLDIFKENIGNDFEDEKLNDIKKEAKERSDSKTPPGFCDNKKNGPDKGYGDFYIWKQVIDEAKSQKLHCIFVTNDSKEDWWHIVNKYPQGAHPMLRKEFNEQVSKEFYICDQREFLNWANNQRKKNKQIAAEKMQELFNSLDSVSEPEYDISPDPLTSLPQNPTQDEIVEWVQENFEESYSAGAPYDKEDERFYYCHGGDYEIGELIEEYFEDVDPKIQKQALQDLAGYGWEWVRKGLY